jgi:cytochrome c oxidase subunit 1
VGTHVFNPAEGGDPLLWQHLFWFFGHPEVYIIFIPALGMVSAIVESFCRRPIFGYPVMVSSLVATGLLGFGLWVHHMFATAVPELGQSFFMAASTLIAIPSGLQIFCWTATIWDGRPRLRTPLLFVVGFVVLFVLGGITGVMVGSVPFDLQVHDSFFVVAHLHYVLIGGAVFPLWGGFYYWFPKFTGRLLDERLGQLNFWLFFVGFNLTFFPMHELGLRGMPRRVYTYLEETGWGGLNALATAGAALIAASVLVFLVNVLRSVRRGAAAGANPWDGPTLEWATDSPPPPYGFLRIPVVEGRDALWARTPDEPVVTGLRSDRRELLVTSVLEADPDHRTVLPENSVWPFAAAVVTAAVFIGSIFTPWAVVWGAVPVLVVFTGWFWPKPGESRPSLGEIERGADGEPPTLKDLEERRKHAERLARGDSAAARQLEREREEREAAEAQEDDP